MNASESLGQALLNSLAVIPGVRWYHLSDPSSPALDELAAHFGIHPLQVEDCRHRRQTARLEEHERYLFIVIKALAPEAESRASSNRQPRGKHGEPALNLAPPPTAATAPGAAPASAARIRFEDFDLILGEDYVLTVDEGKSHLVESVAPRVAANPGLQRPERIAHALIDLAVDQYLPALDRVGEVIDRMEDRVIRRPSPETLREIFRLKRALLEFRRVAAAMREAINALLRRYDSRLPSGRPEDRELRIYFRDVYDHLVRVIDFVETYRDLLTGSVDIYLSSVANRTNEIMKILTIWGTIALPVLLLSSFYGMNIKLPFQDSPHAVALLALGMGAAALLLSYLLRRKHWL